MAIRAIASLVVLAFTSTGCSATWPRQEPQPFPAGRYTVQFTAADVPPEVPERLRSMMIGTAIVTFTPDGRVRNEVNGKIDAEGHYASTSGLLVITDERGPGHCQRERATGVYRWALKDDQLTLTAVEDQCKWRRYSIEFKPWRRLLPSE